MVSPGSDDLTEKASLAPDPHDEMSFKWDRFLNGHHDDRHLDTKNVLADLEALLDSREKGGPDRPVLTSFALRWCAALLLEDAMPLKGTLARYLRERWLASPDPFPEDVRQLWSEFAKNGISLFDDQTGPPLSTAQLALLLTVTDRDWGNVEPLILGTLVENSMSKGKRSSLGAHFTPRVYVERLVRPTIEEPLRNDLDAVRATARECQASGDIEGARSALRAYHEKLCSQRVLDPACGAGNILLVAFDTLKRIEVDVITLWNELGGEPLDLTTRTVSPKQMHGIDIDPISCEVARVVLWIGQLRWGRRFETLPASTLAPSDISNRDALLAYDGVAPSASTETHP